MKLCSHPPTNSVNNKVWVPHTIYYTWLLKVRQHYLTMALSRQLANLSIKLYALTPELCSLCGEQSSVLILSGCGIQSPDRMCSPPAARVTSRSPLPHNYSSFPYFLSLLLPFIPPAMVSVRRQVLGALSGSGWRVAIMGLTARVATTEVGDKGRGGRLIASTWLAGMWRGWHGATVVPPDKQLPIAGVAFLSICNTWSADPTRSLLPRGNRKNNWIFVVLN